MHLLLASAAVTLHPLTMKVLGSAFHSRAKVWKDVVRDAPSNVKQELMMASLLSLVSVDLEKAKEALKTALLMVKMMTHPPPIPQLYLLHFVGPDKVRVFSASFWSLQFIEDRGQNGGFHSHSIFVKTSALPWAQVDTEEGEFLLLQGIRKIFL